MVSRQYAVKEVKKKIGHKTPKFASAPEPSYSVII